MNDIIKSTCVKSLVSNDEELDKINLLAIKPLEKEQVFIFKMVLCSNEVDRDIESFSINALNQLAELFKGKTVISDHNPQAGNQIARIYDTAVVEDGTKMTKLGEVYMYIEAHVYILRCEKNADFIAEIEAGIKKEVSVGCAISKRICSICGTEAGYNTNCGHKRGAEYDGKICCLRLDDAKDAYEVSFVAVPAQKDAGTTKQFENAEKKTEKSLLEILCEIIKKI